MANITPAKLTYKDADGDVGTVPALTNADVTLLNNALQDIEDLKLAYSPGFVKRDFSNVTQDGKATAASWNAPDYDRAITIANYSSFTPDFDGFIEVSVGADAGQNVYVARGNAATSDATKYILQYASNNANFAIALQAVVKKGVAYYLSAGVTSLNKAVLCPFVGE